MIKNTLVVDEVDIHEVIKNFIEKFHPEESIDCSTLNHVALTMVFEKYYFRASTEVGCAVIFNQKSVKSMEVNIIVTGGGEGLRNRDFLGQKRSMMNKMKKFFKPYIKS